MRWKRMNVGEATRKNGPGRRWGHTCNAVREGKFLYVFGGYSQDNCQTNEVHVFDTVGESWSRPVIQGTPPTPRDSHTCTTVGDSLFIFGGTDGQNPLRDLHILDTSSNTWINPNVGGDRPEAREGHSAALVGNRLFIFGGCGKSVNSSDEVYFNDLYILNIETCVWQRALTQGIPPAARDSHTCSSWKNKIIILGGEDQHDYYLSDVHILDTDTLTWQELNTFGQLLPPRAGHLTISFDKYLFVFGGFTDAQNLYDDLYMLDIETGVWSYIKPTGDGPSARFSMAGDCLDPAIRGALAFVGGCNKNLEALDDMYYFYTELSRENSRDDRRVEKVSFRKQLKMKCQERYLLGASNDETCHSYESPALSAPVFTSSTQQDPLYLNLNDYQHIIGKRTFQAKVIQNLVYGYSIETVIDGMPLRGIILSENQPSVVYNPNSKSEVEVMADQEPEATSSIPRESEVVAAAIGAEKNPGSMSANKPNEILMGPSQSVKEVAMNLADDAPDEVLDPDPISQRIPATNDLSIPAGQKKEDTQVVATKTL